MLGRGSAVKPAAASLREDSRGAGVYTGGDPAPERRRRPPSTEIPMRVLSTLVALFPILLAQGCAEMHPAGEYYPELQRMLDQFRVEQQNFAQTEPQTHWSFPGAGDVTVREISLDGYPGNTYVRCRFLYQNTTGKPVNRSWVSLDVLDAEGQMVSSQVSVLIIPVPMPIAAGSYFADELRTQTRGAHLRPGWSWRITCRSEFEQPEEVEGR